jgi:hypothetical protein
MANTYTLIASNVLTSATYGVTFSAIPATYTDLVFRCSTRTNAASVAIDKLVFRTGANTTIYSTTILEGNGAAASSTRESNNNNMAAGYNTAATATSNTFSSTEIYISNYSTTGNKPISIFTAQETNATTAYVDINAALHRATVAIDEVNFATDTGQFIAGSSFYLYGIKNS